MAKRKGKKRRGKKKQDVAQVTSIVKKDARYFVASELADDKMIGQELLGQAAKTLVYEFENEGGETVKGLSYQGVREAVRIINRDRASGHTIQISDKAPVVTDRSANGIDGVEVMVYAQDIQAGGGSWGIKFEPYQKPGHDGRGGTEYNRFAREIALSKAQRNGLFNLLPAHLIESVITQLAGEEKHVEKIEAPATQTREIKPKASNNSKMYTATAGRVAKIKSDKLALEKALLKVDDMPISKPDKARIKRKIRGYLKSV